MKSYLRKGHVFIERVSPEIDAGRYRAKAVAGDVVSVTADIFRYGPDLLQAVLLYKGPKDRRWAESPMRLLDNDRWIGQFQPLDIGRYKYTIEAWTDHFSTWRRDLVLRVEAGQKVDTELQEGAILVHEHISLVPERDQAVLRHAVDVVQAHKPGPQQGFADPRVQALLSADLAEIMARHHDRSGSSTYTPILELTVDRERARFGAWYEFFPRSTGRATKHGTFKTAAKLLTTIAGMGFDVVYLPPIHPIGTTARKGKNNALKAGPSDVGVPWAIGGPEGGHTAVHPELGTIEDFDAFAVEADRLELEIALDLAFQCSPDHPWVKEHPEWFHHRPDGTIKYAENPPKKYQDVYPINFETADKEPLWSALKEIVDFWIGHGVRIFRVDNPHTKPFPFWEWLIDTVQKDRPDVLFLSEAFTRPKVMRALAKVGFTQSYTYFTWRNTKWELTDYLNELTQTEMNLYFRPNFFTNTQDILHEYLQTGGPPAFKIRLVLAAFLSPAYGIYSGFEFFENSAREVGSEEYLDSEKYQLRPRDYDAKESLIPYVKAINEIRRSHPPVRAFTNLHWHYVDKDNVMAFSKALPGHDPILVVVSLNPWHWEEATVSLDLPSLGIDPFRAYQVQDLISGDSYQWSGPSNYVRLDPSKEPAHIFVVKR
jgi:starch synthase (maltosyl-transferring)